MTNNAANKGAVITGIGLSSPAGFSLNEHRAWWAGESLQARSPFQEISQYNTDAATVRYAGEVPELEKRPLPVRKVKKLVNRKDLLGIVTAHAALCDAGLASQEQRLGLDPNRAGCFIGACSTQLGDFTPYFDVILDCVSDDREHFDSDRMGRESLTQVNPLAAVKVLMNGSLAHISQQYDLRGANSNYMDGHLAGLTALQSALEAISAGRIDWAVVGAMAAPLDPFQMADAWHTGRLADQSACSSAPGVGFVRPYDAERQGTVLSEGAGFVVLEAPAHARARGAASYGRVLSVTERHDGSLDQAGPSSPGLVSAMQSALQAAALQPERVGAIYGHGHGDRQADACEAASYAALGWAAPITSLQGAMGDTAEAGALQAVIAACDDLSRNEIQPILGLERPSDECASLNLLQAPQTFAAPYACVTSRNRWGGAACAVIAKD